MLDVPTSANVRAGAVGAVVGVANLLVVLFVTFDGLPAVQFPDLTPGMTIGPVAACYVFGGIWLVGAIPTFLFVRYGTILPLGIAALDLLLYVDNPHVGDLPGPLSLLFWPFYVVVFVLLAGGEYLSLQYVRDKGTGLIVTRRILVGGLFAGLLGLGLWNVLPVWRVLPVTNPLPLRVENDDTVAHQVRIEITNAETGEVVFEETIDAPARDSVTLDAAVTHVGRYQVVGELDDGTTDEFTLEPQHFERFSAILVWVEGELGRLRILGQGSSP
jgi:hypothetical protein